MRLTASAAIGALVSRVDRRTSPAVRPARPRRSGHLYDWLVEPAEPCIGVGLHQPDIACQMRLSDPTAVHSRLLRNEPNFLRSRSKTRSTLVSAASCTSSCFMFMSCSSLARNRPPFAIVFGFRGRVVASDATTESRPAIRGDLENEIASFRGPDPESLQSKTTSARKIESPIKALRRLHGRLVRMFGGQAWHLSRLRLNLFGAVNPLVFFELNQTDHCLLNPLVDLGKDFQLALHEVRPVGSFAKPFVEMIAFDYAERRAETAAAAFISIISARQLLQFGGGALLTVPDWLRQATTSAPYAW